MQSREWTGWDQELSPVGTKENVCRSWTQAIDSQSESYQWGKIQTTKEWCQKCHRYIEVQKTFFWLHCSDCLELTADWLASFTLPQNFQR